MILIVGGQHRKIGKTALIEAILSEFPELEWTAVKITTHHGRLGSEPGVSLRRESAPSPKSDTGRYLAAGAAQAWLVTASPGAVGAACEELRRAGILDGPAVIESGAAAEHFEEGVFLFVADADPDAEFKEAARRYLEWVDAFVVTAPARPAPAWPLRLPPGRPRFWARPPGFRSRPLMEFLRAKLAPPVSRPPAKPSGR